jgi:UDP-glucuronate decarboxylase
MVIEITGSSSKLTRRELPQDDPVRRKPDVSLAEKLFQWNPSTALREGLEKTIEYFEQKLRNANLAESEELRR